MNNTNIFLNLTISDFLNKYQTGKAPIGWHLFIFLQISLYSDMNKFFDTIPKEYVPKDLGGSLPLTRDEYNGE